MIFFTKNPNLKRIWGEGGGRGRRARVNGFFFGSRWVGGGGGVNEFFCRARLRVSET